MSLLGDLFFSPVRGLLAIIEAIHDAARQEIGDSSEALRHKLLELQLAYELGEIEESEYKLAYDNLVTRLQDFSDKL